MAAAALTQDQHTTVVQGLHRLAHAITHRANNNVVGSDASLSDGATGQTASQIWAVIEPLLQTFFGS